MSEDLPSTPIQQSPRGRRARSKSQQQQGVDASPSGQSGAAGGAPEPEIAAPTPGGPGRLCTVEDLKNEFFPAAKRVSGGVLQGLAREMRRRNRRAEKGY